MWQRYKEYILIIVGSITWSLTMVKSGLFYSYGMGFWGPNGHDGIWHIALINSLAKGSLEMPVFAGENIQNYHIGFDALLALIHRLTFVPTYFLYFQLLPPLLALSIGILTYKLVLAWRNSKSEAFWATFFVYFGGSWGWIITLLRGEGFGGESMFWSQQSISTLINPPFALSLVLLLSGLILLLKYEKKASWGTFALAAFIFGAVGQIKVYAGLLALCALLALGVYQLLFKKNFKYLLLFITSLLISGILFVPLNQTSSSLIVYQPFWFLETMMTLTDRVGWQRFYSAMTTYRSEGAWKTLPTYFIAFAIFWFGNLGTRIFKEILFFRYLSNIKKLLPLEVFIYVVIAAGAVVPTLFLQKGTPWNTIQFLYYSLMFSGILAGISFSEIISKPALQKYKHLLILVLLILTLPTTFGTLKHYLPSRPPAKLSQEELGALSFLGKQERGNVLTFPFNEKLAIQAVANPPRPLYLYTSTAYVAAFSGQPVYLEDEINLDITNFDWKLRKTKVENFLVTLNQEESRKFLAENNIRYIYWLKGQRAKLGETQLGIERIYENKEVDIYRRI